MNRSFHRYPDEDEIVKLDWLLQAGFSITSPGGTRLIVDAYISNQIEQIYGKRRIAAVVDAEELAADLILASHVHEDHFDLPWLRHAFTLRETVFAGPPSCVEQLVAAGVEPFRVEPVGPGDSVVVGDVRVQAVPARHMVDYFPTPDAVGFIIELAGFRLYHSGDTVYNARIVDAAAGVDAALVCINGTEGNMDVDAAARLAYDLRARTVVPMHFGLWADRDYGDGATLDPQLFAEAYEALHGQGQVIGPVLDESICLRLHAHGVEGSSPERRNGRD